MNDIDDSDYMDNHHVVDDDHASTNNFMPDPASAALYERCIDLITSCRPFFGVVDTLSIPHVAVQLLFGSCVDACMQYLARMDTRGGGFNSLIAFFLAMFENLPRSCCSPLSPSRSFISQTHENHQIYASSPCASAGL